MAMPNLYKWLKGDRVSEDDPIVASVRKRTHSEDEAKSLGLRLLIHFVGDVHQPLHNANRYTKDKPSGDKGGNDFMLKYHYSANELHAVWDNVIYQYYKSVKRPFTADSFAQQGEIANELKDAFQFSTSEAHCADFGRMKTESHDIAIHVYDGLKEGSDQVVPQSYIDKYAPIAKRRASLAGHRLAYIIENIFSSGSQMSAVKK